MYLKSSSELTWAWSRLAVDGTGTGLERLGSTLSFLAGWGEGESDSGKGVHHTGVTFVVLGRGRLIRLEEVLELLAVELELRRTRGFLLTSVSLWSVVQNKHLGLLAFLGQACRLLLLGVD